MAFTTIPTASIQAGKPTKQELFQNIKDNDDDLESRIVTLESSIQSFLPIPFELVGPFYLRGTQTGVLFYRVGVDINLTDAKLFIPVDGTSGTLEVDLLRSASGTGPYTTIFTTKPSLAQGGGANQTSTNQAIATTSLFATDVLQFDITSVMQDIEYAVLYLEFTVA